MADQTGTSVASVPLITGYGSDVDGYSNRPVPRITATGTGASVTNGSSANVPLITADGSGYEQYGRSDVFLPQIIASGFGAEAGWSVASVPGITAAGTGGEAGGSLAARPRILALGLGYSGAIGGSDVSLPIWGAQGGGHVEFTGSSSAPIPFISAYGTGQQAAGLVYSAVAMHTENQSLTTYTNFPFNSFAKFNGVYLAAGDGGLFTLSGDTFDGVAIQSAARVGMTDMGSSRLKKVDRVYVGLRTDGDMIFRVITEETNVRDYLLAYSGIPTLRGKRVMIGKGIMARYWQFELRNVNGSSFDLNMIELKPQVLSRRVGGADA